MIKLPSSVFIPNTVRNIGLSANEQVLASHVAYRTITNKRCTDRVTCGKQISIPSAFGMSDKQVRHALNGLEDKGLVKRTRTIYKGRLSYTATEATGELLKHFTNEQGKRLTCSPERFLQVLTACIRNVGAARAITLTMLVKLTKEVRSVAGFTAASKALVAKRVGVAVSSLTDQIKSLAGMVTWNSITNTLSLTAACIRSVLSRNNKESRATEIMSVISNMFDFVEAGSMCEIAFIKHCRERIKILVMLGAMADAREVEEMIEVLA